MKCLKTLILAVSLSISLSGMLVAQNNVPNVYLEASEKCNNFARHYCLNGSHEAAVNRALLDMKRKGYRITAKVIKSVARSTPSRMYNPASAATQQ